MTVAFSLRQFSAVLAIRNAQGEPFVLVGGQAVNYWAERYLAREPELAPWRPFTSEDIDFKGERADVEHIARQLQLPPGYPPKVGLTALAGFVVFQVGELKSSIEVVRRLPGLPAASTPAIQVEWEGKKIRVLDPISLLACKLELAATLSQARRRDVEHLRILLPCVRAFLRELLDQVERGTLPAREWLRVAGQVLKLTTRQRARKLGTKHRIAWPEIFPTAAIARSTNGQIGRFNALQWQPRLRQSKTNQDS